MTYSTLAGLSRFRLVSIVFEPHQISDFTVNLSAHDVEALVAFDVHIDVFFGLSRASSPSMIWPISSTSSLAASSLNLWVMAMFDTIPGIMQQEYLDQAYTGRESLPMSFRDASYEGCTFSECDFKELDLAHSRFLDCTFKTCDLSNINLGNARMRDVTFENCKLLGVVWTKLDDLTNPTFKSSILSFGNFSGLKLKKNSFTQCILHDTDFAQADLSECDFSDSDLLNARFDDTTLLKADFQTAFNYLIDPLRNKVRGAKFSLPEAVGLLKGLGVVIK